MSPAQEAAVQNLRVHLNRLESDPRLIPSERDMVRIHTLGAGVPRPRNVGEAKRFIGALEAKLSAVTSEIPW